MGKINLKLSANVKSKTNFIKLIQWQKWARKEKKMPLSKERKYLMILARVVPRFLFKGLRKPTWFRPVNEADQFSNVFASVLRLHG